MPAGWAGKPAEAFINTSNRAHAKRPAIKKQKHNFLVILFQDAWKILVENRPPYLILSIMYYGVMVAFMIYAAFDAPLQARIIAQNPSTYITGTLSMNGRHAVDAQVLQMIGSTFMTNLLGAAYGAITFPSFIIPFVGILTGLYRAVVLGITFAPASPDVSRMFLAHLPTLFIEGQAFILAMLGAFIHGRAIIWPSSVGHTSRWKAYIEGIRQSGSLYVFIMALFILSALYGVLEAALLIR